MSYKRNAFNINQNRNALHDYVKSDWSLEISNDDVVKSQAYVFFFTFTIGLTEIEALKHHWVMRNAVTVPVPSKSAAYCF